MLDHQSPQLTESKTMSLKRNSLLKASAKSLQAPVLILGLVAFMTLSPKLKASQSSDSGDASQSSSKSAPGSTPLIPSAKKPLKITPKTGTKKGSATSATAEDPGDDYAKTATIPDPVAPFNRGIFWFNHQLYRYVMKPISRTYDTVIPRPVRTGIFNVYDNLEYPDRVVNDLLQARFSTAGLETEKFLINSVAGVGGIIKVSNHIPALSDVPHSDTGVTLAKWGIGNGVYHVWPIIGPKSSRDFVGFAGDLALSPLTWMFFIFPHAAWTTAFTAPDSLRNFHDRMATYDAATENTLDRYLALRSSYIQNRKHAESK